MNFLEKMEKYGDSHHPKWLSVIRIFLGLILFSKGVFFLSDREILVELFQHSQLGIWGQLVSPFIGPVHIMGGLLIAIGLITRISAAFNIPILIGAVIFVNLPNGFIGNTELYFSLLVLLLLAFYFVYGSGHFAVGKYMSLHKDK